MRKKSHFRLDTAITAWLHVLKHDRFIDSQDLDELEQHVRYHVAHLMAQGQSEERAFQTSMESMGSLSETKDAYRKVYLGKLRHERKLKDEAIWRLSLLQNFFKTTYRSALR